ncbi:MAG TPA: GntG family PLP-dependent aldolase [Acidimicrobiia bacterium]
MPSPDGRIDLRSDTVTTPTPAMREAMASAPVGDDVFGEDPTINRFQERAAASLGMDAGLYVPSGTMANQIALRTLGRPGTALLCAEDAHVYRVEGDATGDSGLVVRAVPDDGGRFGPGDVERAVAADPVPSLVTIENTYAAGNGRPWRVDEVRAVGAAAAAHGLAVHCDGARIWNASIALGVPAGELVAPATTAMFCISKGLSAPVGSVLCGPGDVVAEARQWRRRLGGAMRQAGVIAAAGLVALDTMIERLADDHRRARHLADALAECFPGSVDPEAIETNMIFAARDRLPVDFLDRLRADGVWALALGDHVRFVTHKDVDDHDLERVVKVLDEMGG